jgi:hypothetical protein
MLAALALFVGCSTNAPVAPLEALGGNCVGTVKNSEGAPMKGASILLVPERYAPLSTENGNGGIDSTVCDDYGRFGFFVDKPGSYNLLAHGNGLYSMRRPVRVNADARVILGDEILKKPGSISGQVHLQGMADHRPAIILIIGTNVYAMPSDSTGAFSIAALAQGSYTLRILTAENGFGAVETTALVTSGAQTTLPCIELQKRFVPVIDSLSVRYDPAMMIVTLAWPAVDMAKITRYNLYCNRSKNPDTIAAIDKSMTTCALDLITSSIDTFRYQIAAIGNDGVEGPAAVGEVFVKTGIIALGKKSHLESFPNSSYYFIDWRENRYIGSDREIVKYDSNGTFMGRYVLPGDMDTVHGNTVVIGSDDTAARYIAPDNSDSGYLHIYFRSFAYKGTDSAGNLYALNSSRVYRSLIRFDDKLNVVRERPIDDSINSIWSYSMAVSATGSVLVYRNLNIESRINPSGYNTVVTVYDSNLNIVEYDSITAFRSICNSATYGNSVSCIVFVGPRERFRIINYDNNFKEISSSDEFQPERFDGFSSFVPPEYYGTITELHLTSPGLYAFEYEPKGGSAPGYLLYVNSQKQAVARVALEHTAGMHFFDNKGNIYYHESNTLFKYSLNPLVHSPTP